MRSTIHTDRANERGARRAQQAKSILESWQTVEKDNLTVEHTYLLSISEGSGCGGTDGTTLLASTTPWTLDTWESVVEAAERQVLDDHKAAEQAAKAAAGSEPVWNEEWVGSRADFDEAHSAWKIRVNEHLGRDANFYNRKVLPFVTELLAGKYQLRSLGDEWVTPVNLQWEDENPTARSLGADIEHGCMCMGSSRSAESAWSIRYDLNLGEDDPWPTPDETSTWITPPVTLLTLPGHKVALPGHVDSQAAYAKLKAAGEAYTGAVEADALSKQALRDELAGLYTDEQMATATFEDHQAHAKDKQRRSSIEWSLRYGLDVAYTLTSQSEKTGVTILGMEPRKEIY